jgi:hypothetical protein
VNIFILDSNIKRCAQYHCDKHVVKMILESAQILSTVLRLNDVDYGYKVTHVNHPCTLWAGKSLSNWKWLRELASALNNEYRFRFKKEINHKSFDLIQSMPALIIPDFGLTSFAQVMPEEYRHKDPVIAYRNYYAGEKGRILIWTKRTTPFWV